MKLFFYKVVLREIQCCDSEIFFFLFLDQERLGRWSTFALCLKIKKVQ